MVSFAIAFRAHVVPRLRLEIDKQAFLMACDLQDWHDSYYEVLHLAIERGALHLAERDLDSLKDWISTTLLEAVDKAEAKVAAIDVEIARQRTADPVGYYEGLATRCRDPERMRWIFAANNPAYCDHLRRRHAG